MQVLKRGRYYTARARVPVQYTAVETRREVKVSLKTDSESTARMKAAAYWAQCIEGWEARTRMGGEDAIHRFEAARRIAEQRGYSYIPMSGLSALPDHELAERILDIRGRFDEPDELETEALLGGIDTPEVKVTEALEAFWEISKDETVNKSADQLRRWKNPLKRSIRTFVEVVGDKPLDKLTRKDFLDFREMLVERVQEDQINGATANKNIYYLTKVLRRVNEVKDLGLDLRMEKLKLKEGEKQIRPPFSSEWIRDRLLAPGALDGLNDQAAAIIRIMVNTGCRPSEICNLSGNTIVLNGNLPYISIEPEKWQLKSGNAKRRIPLLGVALDAARQFPNGFPRYQDTPASLSGLVGKYLKAHNLLELPKHSLYSLRHSFSDRLLAASVDERIRHDLMGHTLKHVRYGEGASMGHLVELMDGVSF